MSWPAIAMWVIMILACGHYGYETFFPWKHQSRDMHRFYRNNNLIDANGKLKSPTLMQHLSGNCRSATIDGLLTPKAQVQQQQWNKYTKCIWVASTKGVFQSRISLKRKLLWIFYHILQLKQHGSTIKWGEWDH